MILKAIIMISKSESELFFYTNIFIYFGFSNTEALYCAFDLHLIEIKER